MRKLKESQNHSQNQKIESDRNFILITASITTLALLLRIYGIGANSLWLDELWALRGAQHDSIPELLSWINSMDYSDPSGFFVLEWLSFRVPFLGPEASLRLFPMIFSVATVPIVGLLADRWFDRKTAICSMLFFSVSMTQIYFAQEARPYSGMIFFTTLNSWLWLEMILPREEERNRSIVVTLYILFSSFGCYFDYYIILVTLGHLIATPILTGLQIKSLQNQIIVVGIISLIFSPGLPKLIRDLNNSPSYVKNPEIYFFRDYQVLHFNDWQLFFWISISLYLFYLLRCINSLKRERPVSENVKRFLPELIFASWLALPAIILVSISWASEPLVTTKKLLLSSPASYILLSKASVEFSRFSSKLNLAPYVLVSILLAHTVFIIDYYTESQKQPMREGINFLIENSEGYSVYAHPDDHFFITYEVALSEQTSIRWYSPSIDHEDFVLSVQDENYGWVLIAENTADPFDVEDLLSDIGPSAMIIDEKSWTHTDHLNEGWVVVKLLLISSS